jgi:4-hydroxy-3-methylbut-2-enyl diphosphate reductase
MARQFDVPDFYRSPVVSRVKAARRDTDPRKKDLAPSTLDFGVLRVHLARHFGFCFGVENAIEIAYKALEENPEKAAAGRVFLLSEMIHNPHVNEDLEARGVRFLRTTSGEQLIPFDELASDDLVIIPAFGAPMDVMDALTKRGIDPTTYDTTCPFVVRVWKKSASVGAKGHTILVHGKRTHEETRATISRAKQSAPVLVLRDMDEAEDLAAVITGEQGEDFLQARFHDRMTEGFSVADLKRIGVVNQTTMLATETAAIAERLRQAIIERDGDDTNVADTSDTLCYATKENQDATLALIDAVRTAPSTVAIIVGGYNSSNTSHLVELCEEAGLPTYFVRDANELVSPEEIHHFDWRTKEDRISRDWLPLDRQPVDVLLTAGASCPDALLDDVIQRLLEWFPKAGSVDDALAPFEAETSPLG